MQGTVIVYGIYTHNQYTFSPENNYLLPVDINDKDDILAKKETVGGCCGTAKTVRDIFVLA